VVFVLQIHYKWQLLLVFSGLFLLTVGSVNLGIFLSTFCAERVSDCANLFLWYWVCRSFFRVFSGPCEQLLCLSASDLYALPLTYANEALRAVMLKGPMTLARSQASLEHCGLRLADDLAQFASVRPSYGLNF